MTEAYLELIRSGDLTDSLGNAGKHDMVVNYVNMYVHVYLHPLANLPFLRVQIGVTLEPILSTPVTQLSTYSAYTPVSCM